MSISKWSFVIVLLILSLTLSSCKVKPKPEAKANWKSGDVVCMVLNNKKVQILNFSTYANTYTVRTEEFDQRILYPVEIKTCPIDPFQH